jgi:hypothetical protein
LVCGAAHTTINAWLTFISFAVLRLMAAQVNVVVRSAFSIACLNDLICFLTTRITLTTVDGLAWRA